MKKFLVLTLIIGGILVLIGVLPFIFAYPFSNDSHNSGPSNLWELILMIAYEDQVSCLVIGIGITFFSLLIIYIQKKSLNKIL